MASREVEALIDRRAMRARFLADRYPASREVLEFYAAVVDLQREIVPCATDISALLDFRAPLLALVTELGTDTLREAARGLDDSGWRCC